jgi:hypothetical protein
LEEMKNRSVQVNLQSNQVVMRCGHYSGGVAGIHDGRFVAAKVLMEVLCEIDWWFLEKTNPAGAG